MNTIGNTNPVRVTPKKALRPAEHDKRIDRSARYSDKNQPRRKKSGQQDNASIDEYA